MKTAFSFTLVTACIGSAACAGDTGAAGASALVSVNTEEPGENCPNGGLRIDTGLDDGAGGETAGDGALGGGEIRATEYVCNGDPGDTGADGEDGAEALITVTDEAAGETCAAGGKRIDTGLDNGDGGEAAGDGILGAGEIDATSYVCDGDSSLITTTDEPPGSNCSAGGQRIDVGLDDGDGGGTAGNGTLEPGEIDDTSYVCGAAPWPAGAGIQQDLSLAALQDDGWTVCFQDTYNLDLDYLGAMAACDGDFMMMACRNGAVDTLTVAAADVRAVVVQEDAATTTAHHVANGVGWYFTPEYSWGFFRAGDDLLRNQCDSVTTNGEFRLCWHTRDAVDVGGYRCGATTGLNDDATWQRLVLVK